MTAHAATDEAHALALDAADPLSALRDEFLIPPHGKGEQAYFCGNSLGLQPRAARAALERELDSWAMRAVEGHFEGARPWLRVQDELVPTLAALVGAEPAEVVVMNALTVNLHLMMASFYRPTPERHAILIEQGAFPSDRHAVLGQLALHGHDPREALIEVAPDADGLFSTTAFATALAEQGNRIALVLLPGVQYLSGQLLDLRALSELAHRQGCCVGFDLAHAVGNVPLALHDSHCDFAVWCSYKYLNGGPGAPAGCFVHARHARTPRPRLAGWWGHQATTRFDMDPGFVPEAGAAGWQVSNPPILALAPLHASLEPFRRIGMTRLRERSLRLTGHLETLIRTRLDRVLEIRTPADPAQRGCQLSLRVRGDRGTGRALFEHLVADGVIGDWREPHTIRLAPVPLYNRHMDNLRAVLAIESWAARR